MPKQFLYDPENPVRWSPDIPIYRPHLGIDIARVATYWSDLELFLAIAYTHLLFGEDNEAFTIYHDMRDWRKRKQAFFNAAQSHKLPGSLKTEAVELYTDFEKLSHERNNILHGTWALSDKYATAIFLAQPRSMNKQLNRIYTALKKMRARPERYPQITTDLSQGTYQEYSHDDFEDMIKRIMALRSRIEAYGNKILANSLSTWLKTHLPKS